MLKFKIKRDHRAIILIILIALALMLLFAIKNNSDIFSRIIPGTTRRTEVISMMGEPDKIKEASNSEADDLVGYETLYYKEKIAGWRWILIWINGSNDIVSAVTAFPEYRSKDPRTYLSYWANYIGMPENIYWTFSPNFRHLAWPTRGISIKSIIWYPPDETVFEISELTIYIPIEPSEYLATAQNLPYLADISPENRFVRGKSDNIDTAPLDPFNWTVIKAAFPY